MSMTVNSAAPNALIEKMTAAAGGAQDKAAPAPEADAMERFQRAMAGGESGPAAAAPVPETTAPGAVAGVQPGARLDAGKITPAELVGDRILQGMSSLSDKVRSNQEQVMAAFDLGSASQADLLKAQFAMLQNANTIAAVSKVAEKTTQGIKTLQQGS